jgi:hypothetical protein
VGAVVAVKRKKFATIQATLRWFEMSQFYFALMAAALVLLIVALGLAMIYRF